MFNLYLGLTMILYTAFPYSGFAVHKYVVLPYVKPLIMTPYLPQGDLRSALSLLVIVLLFLMVTHFVIYLSKIDRLINKTLPVSIVIIISSIIIIFVSIYYSTYSPGNLRSFITQISQTVIIFSLIRLFVISKKDATPENI